jgi:hypothetical protein
MAGFAATNAALASSEIRNSARIVMLSTREKISAPEVTIEPACPAPHRPSPRIGAHALPNWHSKRRVSKIFMYENDAFSSLGSLCC